MAVAGAIIMRDRYGYFQRIIMQLFNADHPSKASVDFAEGCTSSYVGSGLDNRDPHRNWDRHTLTAYRGEAQRR